MVCVQLSRDQREAVLQPTPVRRFCEPEEVAELNAILVSTGAGFIAGKDADVNGGLHMDWR
ncbi:MAG: SDR family oxidoreductase [Paracoccaceae bacterium]|nr:SDR family oxidoreductase [Paracoccaceae bacterium]